MAVVCNKFELKMYVFPEDCCVIPVLRLTKYLSRYLNSSPYSSIGSLYDPLTYLQVSFWSKLLKYSLSSSTRGHAVAAVTACRAW
jgi:hypothetical protein